MHIAKIFDTLLKLGHGSVVNGLLNPDTNVNFKTGNSKQTAWTF